MPLEIPPTMSEAEFRHLHLTQLKELAGSEIGIPPTLDTATYRRLVLTYMEELSNE